MAIFNHSEFDNHEQVVFCSDAETGLKAIIAVHSTALGPAVGGCRLWQYESDEAAVNDVLRLSRGMTYKNAMAGLPLGGGKSVIIGDAKSIKSEALFRAFGRMVHRLSGSYYSAEDVNITTGDIMTVNKETPYVAGLEGKSGNPAPFTALGTYRGIKAAALHQFGSDKLEGKTVADMSRAKQLKSLFRMVTPHLTLKDIPMVVVNHTYMEIGMFPKAIVSGGTGIVYSANFRTDKPTCVKRGDRSSPRRRRRPWLCRGCQ